MTYDDVVWKYPKALLYRLIAKSKRYKENDGLAIDDDGYIDLAESENIEQLERKIKEMAKR